ncbi:PREDICTED: uncharacterized protein LOC109480076 [Branchiostoma belcheri]|uniref:Uncharacterized protein LOC109480076 n=1 Tax=Branchiostoma belcheri TaxID=7741 RepID=A0A6P4ZLW5_BRABE|nr:PREDICTED: uncharacterized protein LOC109480076 [Branchiostoma belcheri]
MCIWRCHRYRSCREGDLEEDRREQCSKPPGLREVDRREQCSKSPGFKEVDRREQCSKPGLSKVAARDHTGTTAGSRGRAMPVQADQGAGGQPQHAGQQEARRAAPAPNLAGNQAQPPLSQQAIRDKIASLEATVQRLSGSASTEALRKELLDHATRPAALFDPRKAISMMEALVDTAKGEGHSDAEQFKLILSQMRRHVTKPYFQELIIDQFGEGVLKKVTKDFHSFVKSHTSKAITTQGVRG